MNDDERPDCRSAPSEPVDEDLPEAPMVVNPRLLIAGLVLAIIANIAVVPMAWPTSAANLSAIVVCAAAIVLVRARMRGWTP